mmetsp:Transcript_21185/g.38087  ORF Transcript_21185/g.38087 Transcript_21185/m.38087 type:complete len:851 (-) Transcript_21185:256-2808(-)
MKASKASSTSNLLKEEGLQVRLSASASTDRLGANENLTAGASKRNNAWHDVLEICKKGFANKMSSMGQEILEDVRAEVQNNLNVFRNDIEKMLGSTEQNSMAKLNELLDSMKKVQQAATTGFVDFSPLVDEIKGKEAASSESMQKAVQLVEEDMTLINDSLEKLTVRTEAGEERMKQLMDKAKESEKKLSTVLDVQVSLLNTATTIANEVQKSNLKVQEPPKMQSQIDNLVDSLQILQMPLDINSKDIVREVRAMAQIDNNNCNLVLSEIAKIQQALHLDFAEMLVGFKAESALQQSTLMPAEIPITTTNDNASRDSNASEVSDPGQPSPPSAESTSHLKRKSTTERPKLLSTRKRVREFWTQTEEQQESKMTQTDPVKFVTEKKKAKALLDKKHSSDHVKAPPKAAFQDAEAMKQKARAALMQPQYNVFDEYYETGWAQAVAKSAPFEYFTLLVVLVNALWLAIDTDNNTAALITDADPGFVVVENIFCTYFFLEVAIRFAAFQKKSRCLQDFWFVFDASLVFMMVLETWIVPIVVIVGKVNLAGILDLSLLRMIRMTKMLRLSRMAKLLRAVPELMIIVKGLAFASRSVLVFFGFWLAIIYVFSVVMRQLSDGQDVGGQYFSSVYHGMNTLLLYGILPEQAQLVLDLGHAQWYFWPIMIFFILLSSLTIFYMLVGVLVNSVGVIAASEKEGASVSFISTTLREKMEQFNYSTEAPLDRAEFQKMLVEPEITQTIQGVGVDIVILVDMLEVVYEDLNKNGKQGLTFEEIIELILNMRGANPATVKDVKEQVRITKSMLQAQSKSVLAKMEAEFEKLHAEMKQLRDEAVKRDNTEPEDEEDEEEEHAEES